MADYLVDVSMVEEWQMTNNRDELDKIFARCKSTIVQGGEVILARKIKNGPPERFDNISTEADLEVYRGRVYQFFTE